MNAGSSAPVAGAPRNASDGGSSVPVPSGRTAKPSPPSDRAVFEQVEKYLAAQVGERRELEVGGVCFSTIDLQALGQAYPAGSSQQLRAFSKAHHEALAKLSQIEMSSVSDFASLLRGFVAGQPQLVHAGLLGGADTHAYAGQPQQGPPLVVAVRKVAYDGYVSESDKELLFQEAKRHCERPMRPTDPFCLAALSGKPTALNGVVLRQAGELARRATLTIQARLRVLPGDQCVARRDYRVNEEDATGNWARREVEVLLERYVTWQTRPPEPNGETCGEAEVDRYGYRIPRKIDVKSIVVALVELAERDPWLAMAAWRALNRELKGTQDSLEIVVELVGALSAIQLQQLGSLGFPEIEQIAGGALTLDARATLLRAVFAASVSARSDDDSSKRTISNGVAAVMHDTLTFRELDKGGHEVRRWQHRSLQAEEKMGKSEHILKAYRHMGKTAGLALARVVNAKPEWTSLAATILMRALRTAPTQTGDLEKKRVLVQAQAAAGAFLEKAVLLGHSRSTFEAIIKELPDDQQDAVRMRWLQAQPPIRGPVSSPARAQR